MRNFHCFAFPRPIVSALLVTGLVLSLASPASVAAPEGSDSRQQSIWRDVLDRMPSAWRRARRVEIRWVSDREMDRLIADQEEEDQQRGDDSSIQGFYDRAPDDRSPASITVRANLDRQDAVFVLSHEFAHMVWDEVLTRRERSDYRRLWEDQKHIGRLVSRYAGESPEEGFAEAVASYLWESSRLRRRDLHAFDFVDDLVRAAEEKAVPAARSGPRS